MSSSDVENGTYNLNDVILPLPGNNINFPPNMEQIYMDTLEVDGVLGKGSSFDSFRIKQLHLNIPGTYRKVIEFPRNLSYR